MARNSKKLIFRPLSFIFAGLATAITIILGALQIGHWVSENAAWSLWAVIVALLIAIFLLLARIEALKAEVSTDIESAPQSSQTVEGLSEPDRNLASQLWGYASDEEILTTLGEFFPYEIPRRVVRSLEELARLPMSRAAHNAELAEHLSTLSETASQWLEELGPLITVEDDHYTTRLEHWVSDEAYRSHDARTTELGNTGFDLHGKFLNYQRYFSSRTPASSVSDDDPVDRPKPRLAQTARRILCCMVNGLRSPARFPTRCEISA